MRQATLAALLTVSLAAQAHAADALLQGSMGQAFAIDIGSTHADTVTAAAALEDTLWPSLQRHPDSVRAFASTRLLHNMLQAPANVSGTGQSQGIATYPYGVQGIDVWLANVAVGYRHAWFSLFYDGAFVGTHDTQMGTIYPLAAAGLMGLGLLEATVAPVSSYRTSKLANAYLGSAARYVVGGALHYEAGSLRIAYVGGTSGSVLVSAAHEPWSLSATAVVDSQGNLPFLRLGLLRSSAPAKALFGDDVGTCPPEDHCVVPPLTSLYARAYELSIPQPGFFPQTITPHNAALWTAHLEQLNFPMPLGLADVRLALGMVPTFFVHEAMLMWHSATFHGGELPTADWPPIDFAVSAGYAQMPTLRYANNPGNGVFAFSLDARWSTWISAGFRRNLADTFALFPFALASSEVYVTLSLDALLP